MVTIPERIETPPIMRLIIAVAVLVLGVLFQSSGEAQQARKVYRVGYLGNLPGQAALWQRFVGVFREAGLIEGQHVVFERRFGEGYLQYKSAVPRWLGRVRI